MHTFDDMIRACCMFIYCSLQKEMVFSALMYLDYKVHIDTRTPSLPHLLHDRGIVYSD